MEKQEKAKPDEHYESETSELLCDCPEPIPELIINDLLHYLLDHEEDIAMSINDFGTLKSLFSFTMNREAKVT